MNTASLELCKELYELSGWEDTEKMWLMRGTMEDEIIAEHIEAEFGGVVPIERRPEVTNSFPSKRQLAPAYDLGYLLRKLEAAYEGPYELLDSIAELVASELTYEDAAAKLCIELLKQGILKKES